MLVADPFSPPLYYGKSNLEISFALCKQLVACRKCLSENMSEFSFYICNKRGNALLCYD